MTHITIEHLQAGITATELRKILNTEPWTSNQVTVNDPAGNIFHTEIGANILCAINNSAKIINPTYSGTDYLKLWEKEYIVTELTRSGFNTNARDTSQRYGSPKEWDVFLIALDKNMSNSVLNLIKQDILVEYQSPELLTYGADLKTFAGRQGKRCVLSCTTINQEVTQIYYIVHRHAFDIAHKEVSAGLDLSSGKIVDAFFERLQKLLTSKYPNIHYKSIRMGKLLDTRIKILEPIKAITTSIEDYNNTPEIKTNEQVFLYGGFKDRKDNIEIIKTLDSGEELVYSIPMALESIAYLHNESMTIKKKMDSVNVTIVELKKQLRSEALKAAALDKAIQVFAQQHVENMQSDD